MPEVTPSHVPVQRIVIAFIVVIVVGVLIALIGAIYRLKKPQVEPITILSESQKIEYLQQLNDMRAQTPVVSESKKTEYLKVLNTQK